MKKFYINSIGLFSYSLFGLRISKELSQLKKFNNNFYFLNTFIIFKSSLQKLYKTQQTLNYGFYIILKLIGRSFRCKQFIDTKKYFSTITKSYLLLSLGYTHNIILEIPKTIIIHCSKKKRNIYIFGYDKITLIKFVANIRKCRKVEPYKGKGIQFLNENIKLRIGKIR